MKTVDTNEQLKEYGNELASVIEVLELFKHNVDSLSMIKEEWAYSRISKQFHDTQFRAIQTLIHRIGTIVWGILDIAEMGSFSPSRNEVIEHYLQMMDSDNGFIVSPDADLKAKDAEVSTLLDKLLQEIGFDDFNRLNEAQVHLSNQREQERYISGFYEGLSYAKLGKWTD